MTARRGEVWLCDFDPVRGHEQAGRRPALVLSADTLNAGPGGLVTVLPITSRQRPLPSRVPMTPPEGGLTTPSFVIAEQIRTVALDRLTRRLGVAHPQTMRTVENIVRMVLVL